MTVFKLVILMALLLLLHATPLSAQDSGNGPDNESADTEGVDREEADFRRSMELEEEDDDDNYGNPSLPDTVDVEPMPLPDDSLPPDSRAHLEGKLTDLIIANGRWAPADAAQETPYEASEAAELDPELRAEEAAEWEEMVAAYHAREQAAYEQAGGMNSGQGAGTSGSDADSNSGAGAGTGTGSVGASGAPPGSSASSQRTPREVHDESFSALDFLEDETAAVGNSGEEQGAGAADPDSEASTESATVTPTANAENDVETNNDQLDDFSDGASEINSGFEPDSEPVPEQELPASVSEPNAESENSSGIPDGSMSMEALEALFEEQAATESIESAPPLEPTDPSADDQMTGLDAEAGSDSDRKEEASSDTPPKAPPPQPENTFMAWLRSLFSRDKDP